MMKVTRGGTFLTVDRKVWVFVLGHLLMPALLLAENTRLVRYWAALPLVGAAEHTFTSGEGLMGLLAAAGLLAAVLLYASLYASDPGFMDDGPKWAAVRGAVPRCRECTVVPSSRWKHSRCLGRCVHKFDHSCWLLSTDIGDMNHRRFWWYLAVEMALLLWAVLECCLRLQTCLRPLAAASPACGPGFRAWRLLALLAALLPPIAFFGFLLLLHTYLAATNQTTYEVIKGPRVPYLEPFYQHYRSSKRSLDMPLGLLQLLALELRGRPRPRPFSRGLAADLHTFFLAARPFHHRFHAPPPLPAASAHSLSTDLEHGQALLHPT